MKVKFNPVKVTGQELKLPDKLSNSPSLIKPSGLSISGGCNAMLLSLNLMTTFAEFTKKSRPVNITIITDMLRFLMPHNINKGVMSIIVDSYQKKDFKDSFERSVETCLRFSPDVLYIDRFEQADFENIVLPAMSGHMIFTATSKDSVSTIIKSVINDDNFEDFIMTVNIVVAQKMCYTEKDNPFIITEYCVFDHSTKDYVYSLPNQSLNDRVSAIQNLMFENKTSFKDDLDLKLEDKQISHQTYKKYVDLLYST